MRQLFILVFICWSVSGVSQVTTDTLSPTQADFMQRRMDKKLKRQTRNFQWNILPLVYFTPETDWAFGLVSNMNFRIHPKDTSLKKSIVIPSVIYTLNKQVMISAQYDLQLNHQWSLVGNVGFYLYPYFYWGTGNNHDGSNRIDYTASYPLVHLNAYRRIGKSNFKLGAKWYFQHTYDVGLLIPPQSSFIPEGAFGSTQNAFGLEGIYSTRDHELFPTQGWFVRAGFLVNNVNLGGTYNDFNLFTDVRKHIPLRDKGAGIALQFIGQHHNGQIPFNLMPMLGGSRQMRGYRQGMYRDRNMLVYQADYHTRYFFNFLSLGVFGSVGGIGRDLQEVNQNYRYAYGGGLRIKPFKEEKVFFRIDAGFGENTSGLYIDVGSAF